MADLALRRVETARQTLGVLSVIGGDEGGTRWSIWECWTLELPWEGNRNRKSCIPPEPGSEAVYEWERHQSPTFGECIWVRGVPGRSEIVFHAGNFVSDTAGCILVGDTPDDLDRDGLLDVTDSQDTMTELMERVGDGGELSITWEEQVAEPADLSLTTVGA